MRCRLQVIWILKGYIHYERIIQKIYERTRQVSFLDAIKILIRYPIKFQSLLLHRKFVSSLRRNYEKLLNYFSHTFLIISATMCSKNCSTTQWYVADYSVAYTFTKIELNIKSCQSYLSYFITDGFTWYKNRNPWNELRTEDTLNKHSFR